MDEREREWTTKASNILVGRRITEVSYMPPDEADAAGWYARSLVLTLDDGTKIYPMADDEGNGPGAFGVETSAGDVILPVLDE